MVGPNDDMPDFRPLLTTGRDAPYPWAAAKTLEARPQFSVSRTRVRVRHFATRGGLAQLRAPVPKGAGRRVMVKVRVIKTSPTTRTVLATHFCYVRRGMEAEGQADAAFFSRDDDVVDTAAFSRDCAGDRHHFRLVVNPEDGTDLPDLRAYGREFLARVERDLDTPLHWVAGAHFDTGRPHLHMVIRGCGSDGRALLLTRDYIKHGLRSQAETLATELLGPGRPRLIVQSRDLIADGFTALDRKLIEAAPQGALDVRELPEHLHAVALRRLVHLETGGWVSRRRDGHWKVPAGLRDQLQVFGEHEARRRVADKILWPTEWSHDRARLEPVLLQPGARLIGAFVGCEPLSRFPDGPQILILDLEDGRLGHVRIPQLKQVLALDRLEQGAVVEVRGRPLETRASDQTIMAVSKEGGGVYSGENHRASRPTDSPAFIERHLQRLRMMGREGACAAMEDGSFVIPEDYAVRALRVDAARNGPAAPEVRVLDGRSVNEQVTARAHTYLDTLMGDRGQRPLQGPFGKRVSDALARRQGVLERWGIGSGHPRVLGPMDARVLTTMEIQTVFEALGAEGKPVFMAGNGEGFAGVYASRVRIDRQAFAVIEGRHSITLVPWKAGLEAGRGLTMTGIVRDGATDFRVGLQAARGLGLEL